MTSTPAVRLRVLFPLFFASGACGLIYQVVWMRALALTLSVTVYAVTTVLCAFMAGLALGAFLAGRHADRLERPLLAFGLVEIGVGLTGIVTPRVLLELGPAYGWLAANLGEGPLLVLARFGFAAAVLLVPTTLMGMTLPLLSRAAIERDGEVGRGAGGLYGVNTLGAVAGCIAAGFALIPELGLTATSSAAAAVNLLVGVAAIARSRRAPGREVARAAPSPGPPDPLPGRAALAVLAFGVSGFTAFGYEVLWTRALEQFVHNSTYAYTAMLAMFLLGIGGGSAVTAVFADRVRRPLAAFGTLQIGIGVSVIVALLIYMRLLDWIPAVAAAIGGLTSWGRVLIVIFGVAGLILLGTALLFGAGFPFVARAVVTSPDTVGRRIALAYTWNTLGSIAGALTVGFLLLPALGLRGSFVCLLGLNLLAGAGLCVLGAPRRTAWPAAVVATGAFAVALLAIPPRLFEGIFTERYGSLLLYREQVTDTVMVTEDPKTGERFIRYGDGRGTAGTPTVIEDRSYAHTALLLHPEPRDVLNICFGVGNSLSSVLQYPVRHVDAVELSPGVTAAAPFFERTNRGALRDPRTRLTIQDGRNFLLSTRNRYDVIRLDPPEIHTAGVVNLYTLEFFELAREHLAPGGIFSIWINIAYTPEDAMRRILRTAAEAFPYVSVWHSPYLYSWVINGSVEPRPPDAALLRRHFSDRRVRRDLASIGIHEPTDFLGYFVMAGDEVTAFAADAVPITDDRTQLDFVLPRSVESFFGISNSVTDDWLVDLMARRESLIAKSARMCAHKRSVLPHLRNAEALGLPGGELAAKLDARLGSLPHGCTGEAAGAPLLGYADDRTGDAPAPP